MCTDTPRGTPGWAAADTTASRVLRLRAATLEDAETLLSWRNDAQTRAASVSRDPVSSDAHIRWLNACLADPTQRLLVAEIDAPVGTVRLQYGTRIEMSWTVSPAARGQGIGQRMVRAACPDGIVMARIRRENIPSQRIAAAAGLVLVTDGALQVWQSRRDTEPEIRDQDHCLPIPRSDEA